MKLSNLLSSACCGWVLTGLFWLIGPPAHADGVIHHGPRLDIQIQRGAERLPLFQVPQLRQGDKVLVKPQASSLAKGDWVLMLGRISPAGNEVATKTFDLARLEGYAELEMTGREQVPVIVLAPQLRNMFGLYTSFMESELLLKEVIQSDPQRFYDLQKVDQVNQAITALTQGLDQVVVNRNPEQAMASAKAMAFKFGVSQVDPDCFKGNTVNTQCVAMSIVANKDFVLPASSDLGMLVGSKGAADLTKFLTDKFGIFSDATDFLTHKFRDQYDFASSFGRRVAGSEHTELFSLARFRNGSIKTAYVYVPAWFKVAPPVLKIDAQRPMCFMDDSVPVQVMGRLPVVNYWHSWALEVSAVNVPQPLATLSDVAFEPERGVIRFKRSPELNVLAAQGSTVLMRLRGRFGFDPVDLPVFSMDLPMRGDVGATLQGARTLVAGEGAELSLDLAQGAACVEGMGLSMADQVVANSTAQTPTRLTADLSHAAAGDAMLTVRIKGAPLQSVPLKVLAPRAQVAVVAHAELDEFIQVRGKRLSRIASLRWQNGLCLPRDLLQTPEGDEQLWMACHTDVRSNASLPNLVFLHHQGDEPEPVRMRLQKSPAAPRVVLAPTHNALLVRPSTKALQWGLKPQDEFFSDDSGLSLLLQTVDGYIPGKGLYTLQLRFTDDPVTGKKPISVPLMADVQHKELRTRQPVHFKGSELPSVINPLEFRVVHDATGLFSAWTPLGRSVLMLPEFSALGCGSQPGRVWLHGSQLDLINAARFTDPAQPEPLEPALLEPCPDGLCLSLPAAARLHKLHLSLGWVSGRVFQVETAGLGDCQAP